MINEVRFFEIVSAYGADPARWPDSERAAALAFTEAHPDKALALQNDAERLDDVLALARIAPPSEGLSAKILAAGQAETRFAPSWARLAAVLALSAGLGLGWAGAGIGGVGEGDAAYALAFSSLEEPALEEVTNFMRDEAGQ